jgi:hypothetical protein
LFCYFYLISSEGEVLAWAKQFFGLSSGLLGAWKNSFTTRGINFNFCKYNLAVTQHLTKNMEKELCLLYEERKIIFLNASV